MFSLFVSPLGNLRSMIFILSISLETKKSRKKHNDIGEKQIEKKMSVIHDFCLFLCFCVIFRLMKKYYVCVVFTEPESVKLLRFLDYYSLKGVVAGSMKSDCNEIFCCNKHSRKPERADFGNRHIKVILGTRQPHFRVTFLATFLDTRWS